MADEKGKFSSVRVVENEHSDVNVMVVEKEILKN